MSKRVLIREREADILNAQNRLIDGSTLLSNLIIAIDEAGLGIDVAKLNLPALVADTEGVINKALEDNIKVPNVGGLKLSKAKFIQMLDVDTSKVIALGNEAKAVLKKAGVSVAKFYKMDSDGAIEMNEVAYEAELDQYRTYAETPNELKALKELTTLQSALNCFNEYVKGMNGYGIKSATNSSIDLSRYVTYNKTTQEFDVPFRAISSISR